MPANIIDGKQIAAEMRAELEPAIQKLAQAGITPGLAVVLVGDDPASQVYVRSKGKQTVEMGMNSFEHKLDADTSEASKLGVTGTPAFFVNGRFVSGAQPFETFKRLIDEELGRG